MTGSRSYWTYGESPGASNAEFREPSASAHYGAARELGVQQGLITAERERLNADHAHAIADVQNRNAQLNWQIEKAHNNLSVRETNIAGASDRVRELKRQLETTRAQLQERECQLGALSAQLQDRESRPNARDARQAARDAETAGRDEAPATRRGPADGPAARPNTAKDGVTTQPHQPHRLMVGGVPRSAFQRSLASQGRQAISLTSQGNLGDHIPIPRCLCLLAPPLGRPFRYRRRGTKLPSI
ncbi:hypothetical protein MOQ_007731 [Trypanosoma cruzi marinkellei]|uniref:Uncharacterized protein n=1 Tax=Trypanosoma cruzi marinkellei TaxID=85056 RepID=K2MS89_TRYCR|nr:hypothetical protein MOQ_007731 [Trypanosoma cruzi marinkellei]